jgi:chromosome segregation ATPase
MYEKPMPPSVIETGVDKLVELVKSSKRISVPDAARALNVSKVVVEEWASFLEEEGIISIEYKFTTPYLVDRVLSKKEVEDKIKDFSGKREGFIRKAETTLSLIDQKGEIFKKIKDDFKGLKDELGQDLQTVQSELASLEKYNQDKRSIDSEMREQEKAFKQRINEMESQTSREQQRYAGIIEDIKKQQTVLDKERVQALSIKQMLTALESTMNRFSKTVDVIRNKLSSEEHLIDNSEEHITRLKGMADSARKEIADKRSQMQSLMQKSREQEKKIIALQKSILEKTAKRQKLAPKKTKAKNIDQLKKFLSQNKAIEDFLDRINAEKEHLEHELAELIRKAKAFQLVSKSQDIKGYVADLNKKFKQVEKDKDSFEREVTSLKKLMKV